MSDNCVQTATCDPTKSICAIFEKIFFGVPLEEQIARCDRDELAPLFKRWLPGNQPILEAGSGSGRMGCVVFKARLAGNRSGLERSTLCAS